MYVIFFDNCSFSIFSSLDFPPKRMFSLSPAVLKILVHPRLTTFENYY